MDTIKAKSAVKSVLARGPKLEEKKLHTMAVIAAVVGGTLGPGGHPVLIERPEYGLAPTITKDGVTVFKSLGFQDAVEHCIMEAARDASVRTAVEAGDGTTTATILAEAFVRRTSEYCKAHPGTSPQVVVRRIKKLFTDILAPELDRITVKADLASDEGRRRLESVARVSANGDVELARAVMKCYDITGDDGNVTIVESSGSGGYQVERIDGYPIEMGYETSCGHFFPAFINKPGTQQVFLEKPAFVLYFGRVNDIQTLIPLMQALQEAAVPAEAHGAGGAVVVAKPTLATPNVVVVATGFSESVVASLANNWSSPGSINIFPLVAPQNVMANSQRHFIDDLAAVTGATVFDPVTNPLENAGFDDIGNIALDSDDGIWKPLGVTHFECGRYRSTVVGYCQEDILLARVNDVRAMAENAESTYDANDLRVRLAKLTNGIAKLKVVGASHGDIKERCDRAEDAVCAVRGAIKDGCLIGGCWALARLDALLGQIEYIQDPVVQGIVRPALQEPLTVLLRNLGHTSTVELRLPLERSAAIGDVETAQVYNGETGTYVNGLETGLLDSKPAVYEALKNSISIATLLGTLGGTVVFPRDLEFERRDARDASEFNRMISSNPADERA